ncbi:MAG: helix-turn-helix domain-containing protein [Actinomycetia bacterium]|nr:helix-turn-helix domain-containing protein [Actinomycetes bacterium]
MTTEASAHSRPGGRSQFLSVAEQANELGVSEVTLYRAIKAGEFPAVRIRGRLIIPAGAVDAMVAAALADRTAVDASRWVVVERGMEA